MRFDLSMIGHTGASCGCGTYLSWSHIEPQIFRLSNKKFIGSVGLRQKEPYPQLFMQQRLLDL